MILEHIEQQLLLRVDDDADAAPREALHDALVDIVGEGLWDGAREHERIARAEAVEAREELLLLRLADVRPLAVDLRLTLRLRLDIDAREPFLEAHELMAHRERIELPLDLVAREACDEAERRALVAEVVQDDGDVDALAAREHLLVVHAVDLARRELIEADDVVERRIERDGVDHGSSPSRTVV